MKSQISQIDLELIASIIVPGNYQIDIKKKFNKIQENEGEFLADYNTPCSFVLINYDPKMDCLSSKYDYVIDFSNKARKNSIYKSQWYTLKLNSDGSIQYLYRKQKVEKFWHINFFKKRELNLKIYFKQHIFLEKQIRHLPCDNFWVNFGTSHQNRKIDTALFLGNSNILNLKVASDQKQLSTISKQKYFMSKLSFFDFETIELPNEYFSKNSKVLISSIIISEKNRMKYKDIFPSFIEEIFTKTGNEETIENSIFWLETWKKINQICCSDTREKLMNFAAKIDSSEKMHFCLSFGKLEETTGNKFVCSEFSEAKINAPLLSDFFFLIIEDLVIDFVSNRRLIEPYIEKQLSAFNIEPFVQDKQLKIEKYFNLFLLNYVATEPNQQNLDFMLRLTSSTGKIFLAS